MVVEGLSLCWPSPRGKQCEQVLPVPVPGVSALRCLLKFVAAKTVTSDHHEGFTQTFL